MTFADILAKYEEYKIKYGADASKYISELFAEMKPLHKEFKGALIDHEQSWKSFLGGILENLLQAIIQDEIRSLGLEIIRGNKLEKTLEKNLSDDLIELKRNLLVEFGEFGYQFPDADMILYFPESQKVFAIISIKTSLRERIAQTGYWKIKLTLSNKTKHIRVFFMTTDKDKVFTKVGNNKPRAIAEFDTDGCYVFTTETIRESAKVKTFDKFIDDLREMLKNAK